MIRSSKLIPESLLIVVMLSCSGDDDDTQAVPDLDFRQEMRDFVIGISAYAKTQKPSFLIIPQNGQEILTDNGEPNGTPATNYINAIDATGREDLFYGYTADDVATPAAEHNIMKALCDVALAHGKTVMVTDYCTTQSHVDDSYAGNLSAGYLSFAANTRELTSIPTYPQPVPRVNDRSITSPGDASNFLYLLNSANFPDKAAFLNALRATNYDVLLIDLYYQDDALTASDVASLHTKANGGSRLVLCYMSIGEAEDYRYYWPALSQSLVYKANPDWPGNYTVKYWEADWKRVIYGNPESYTSKIINAGFDGVYLDIIEAYEIFE